MPFNVLQCCMMFTGLGTDLNCGSHARMGSEFIHQVAWQASGQPTARYTLLLATFEEAQPGLVSSCISEAFKDLGIDRQVHHALLALRGQLLRLHCRTGLTRDGNRGASDGLACARIRHIYGPPNYKNMGGGSPLGIPNSYLFFSYCFGGGGGAELGVFDMWFQGMLR